MTAPRCRDGRRVGALLAAALLAGCSAVPPSPSPTQHLPPPVPSATTTPASTPIPPSPTPAGPTPPVEHLFEPFPGNAAFHAPTTVDNRWFPLVPGMRWVWRGSAIEDGKRVPRRVVFTVTDLVKVIDGIQTRVALDIDDTDGELDELEIALFAQADDGTVWHFGQYPEEYDGDRIAGTPAWVHGIQDASAGITMKPEPDFYAPSYSQGWGPAVGWTDRARVFDIDTKTCVKAGCYEGVLVIDEFNRDEPDAHQLKYYAPGVGGIRIGWAGAGEEEREELELVSVSRLSGTELAVLDADVRAMDLRAYTHSPDVWGLTEPIAQP